MSWRQWVLISLIGVNVGGAPPVLAGDLKITLPRRSHATPVQRLNQEGVDAVRKQGYEKAETLFYKAYLLDPDDPFTLNNLGYIAELQGKVDRAQRFYALAKEQPTDAVIFRASSERVEGRSINEALALSSRPLDVSRDNIEAVRLLSQGRAPEVDLLLQQTLKNAPHNVFTLNNMGVAKEMEGESQEALKYYDAAAAIQSDSTAGVALDPSGRGKPVNVLAAENATNLRQRINAGQSTEARLSELNLRGVSAINRNDLKTANQDFRSAYALDPNDAFALNNIGYVAELEGDRETAQFFYDRARAVAGPDLTVGLATRGSAKGMKLSQVASDNDIKVEARVDRERAARRQQNEPIMLRRRDGTPVEEPTTPPINSSQQQQGPASN